MRLGKTTTVPVTVPVRLPDPTKTDGIIETKFHAEFEILDDREMQEFLSVMREDALVLLGMVDDHLDENVSYDYGEDEPEPEPADERGPNRKLLDRVLKSVKGIEDTDGSPLDPVDQIERVKANVITANAAVERYFDLTKGGRKKVARKNSKRSRSRS